MGRRLFILFTWITFHLPVICPSQSDMGCRITLVQNVKREFNMAVVLWDIGNGSSERGQIVRAPKTLIAQKVYYFEAVSINQSIKLYL